jgi:hypothetical protein
MTMADRDHRIKPVRAPAVPRRFLVWNLIGVCVAVPLGLVLYIGQNSDFGLAITIWALVATPITWRWQIQNGRRLHDPANRKDRRTGQTLMPPAATEILATDENATRWTGAADVPTPFGRISATNPLALLAVVDSTLTLRLRPEALARWTCGVEPLALSPSEVETVYPARGRLRAPAIGIRPLNGPPSYFLTAPGRLRWYFGPWSADRASILSAIEAAGFPVEWEEHAFSRS